MEIRKVWHLRMRQGEGKNQRDFSSDAIDRHHIGIGCNACQKPFDPRNVSDSELLRIEAAETWSKRQGSVITQFIRNIEPDDIILLARESGTGNLAVGLVTDDLYYVDGEKLPLRRSMDWKNASYDRTDLLGFQFYGLGTLKRQEELDDYGAYILNGTTIKIAPIHYSEARSEDAIEKIKIRFRALYPSYFEDLVGFIAQQNGLQIDRFMKGKSNDAAIDLRGWRASNLFRVDNPEKIQYSIQVKRREITAKDIELLSGKLKPGGVGILATSGEAPESLKDKGESNGVQIVGGNELARCVLEFQNKLPDYLAQMFKIVRDD